jgi:hypothetical protein
MRRVVVLFMVGLVFFLLAFIISQQVFTMLV